MMIENLNGVYQNLGKEIYSYLEQIEKLLSNNLKNKQLEKFSTNSVDYYIVKIKNVELYRMDYGAKIHRLFSPNGCEISGTLKVVADTYADINKNAYSPCAYLMDFNPIHINYSYDKECFELGSELEIKNIRKERML